MQLHYHYNHYNNKPMIRSRECPSCSHISHTYIDVVPEAMCGNMPQTILNSCVKRGLAHLCLGLYHTRSQREMVQTWPHQAEQKMEWNRRDREGLGGVDLPWGKPKASADVLEIRIWKVNTFKWRRREEDRKGTQVGKKFTVEGINNNLKG